MKQFAADKTKSGAQSKLMMPQILQYFFLSIRSTYFIVIAERTVIFPLKSKVALMKSKTAPIAGMIANPQLGMLPAMAYLFTALPIIANI